MNRWRFRREAAATFGAYAAVVTVIVALLVGLGEERAIPAFALQREAAKPGNGRGAAVLARVIPDLGKSCLRQTIPMIGMEESEPDEALSGQWLLRMLVGVGSLDPVELLFSVVPGKSPKLDMYAPLSVGLAGQASSPDVLFSLGVDGQTYVKPVSSVPLVAIYHSHAKESFLPEAKPSSGDPEDAYSNDMSITVMRVGREIAKELQRRYGVASVHSPEVHDSDGKLVAYARSEYTVRKIVKEYPQVKLILDVHRDSQPRSHTSVEVQGKTMARVMVVLGTDNPRWKENLRLAQQFLDLLEQRYPGISLGVYPKPGRFNQHYSPGCLLLEVGGVDNTLEEELATARAIAEVSYLLVK
ncbi:MAG: stage II sporulation protein P [Bacillota bacterium]